MENNTESRTNIVAARARYEAAKNDTDFLVSNGIPPVSTLAAERRAAQDLVNTVGAWHEERAHRALRELSITLGTYGRVEQRPSTARDLMTEIYGPSNDPRRAFTSDGVCYCGDPDCGADIVEITADDIEDESRGHH